VRAVFVDRDGTLSLEGGYCHPDDFQLAPWAAEGIRLLNQHGLPVVMVTSQSGVAHGRFTVEELRRGFSRMMVELSLAGAYLTAIYYCPHIAPAQLKQYEKECQYHKPKPGMLLRAAHDLQVNAQDCFMVGDTGGSDIVAGSAAGSTTVLVRTGWGEGSLTTYRQAWTDIEPDNIADTFRDAADWIVSQAPEQDFCVPSATPIVEL